MATTKQHEELKALRALYTDNEYAKVILDDFARRANRQNTTGVEQIMSRLRSVEVPKWSVVKLFRGLDEQGYGRFIVGRRGGESRFVWAANAIEVAKAAQGEDLAITSLSEPETAETELVTHQFTLRPGMSVKIELPLDFTEKEADRFSQFLRALPFAN
jgi:hypothetical protein